MNLRVKAAAGLLLGLVISCVGAFSAVPIDIIFTHDMHSALLPREAPDGAGDMGGFARLKSAIDSAKKDGDPLVVDGGDFSMGTLFQSIYATDASELRMMGALGYDVATLGNHEFDFRSKGLSDMLSAAKDSGEPLPQLVLTNYSFGEQSVSAEVLALKQAFSDYPVQPYVIVEKNGYKIGVFGIMGKDADASAPTAELEFTDAVQAAKAAVSQLRDVEKVDLVVCLSHSGTDANRKKSEDELMAKSAPGIDVIVSGHTHTTLDEYIKVGDTYIVSCGPNAQNYGRLTLERAEGGKWNALGYAVLPLDGSVAADEGTNAKLDGYKAQVNAQYLERYGYAFDQVLAKLPFETLSVDETDRQGESRLANLMTDAYIYAVQQAEGENYKPVALSVVPAGTIRAPLSTGDVTVADAFAVSSLGIGKDGLSGYPLLDVYLTGAEIKTACEIDASVSDLMPAARLYMSGVSYTINPHRLMLNKSTNVYLQNPDGSEEELEDKQLYRVVAGLYSAQMLCAVQDVSLGILKVTPKDENGKAIKDFESRIICMPDGSEVKEWVAVANYLESFSQEGGVAVVPEYYNQLQGRKVMDDTRSPSIYFSNLNGYAYAIYGIICAVLILIIVIVILIVKLVKRIRKRKAL